MELETLINPPQSVFDQIIHWTTETEGWGHQLADYNYWSTSFDKYWLFTVVEKGTTNLVASLSLARWDDPNDTPLYSVGLFYCLQKYRGQAIAKKLFEKVMGIVGNDNATLTGIVYMADKYASVFGFDKVPDYWHNATFVKTENLVMPEINNEQYGTKNWSDVDPELLHEYDRKICARNRRKMQTNWFNLKNTFTKVVFDITTNKIVGYATIRIVSKNKLSTSPFYAENLDAAKCLLSALLHQIPLVSSYESIGFTHPAINQDTIRLLQTFAKSPEDVQSAPFYKSQFTKKFIQSPTENVYSVSDATHQFV